MLNIKATAMNIQEWNEMKRNERKKKQFSLNDSRLVNWTSKNCEHQLNSHHSHTRCEQETQATGEKNDLQLTRAFESNGHEMKKGKRWRNCFDLYFQQSGVFVAKQNRSYGNRITCSNIYHSLIVYEYIYMVPCRYTMFLFLESVFFCLRIVW